MKDKKIRVGLIYGGRSGEHDVSLNSALSVMRALDYTRYEVLPYYISRSGEWRQGSMLSAPLTDREALTLPNATRVGAEATQLMSTGIGAGVREPDGQPAGKRGEGTKMTAADAAVDVVFPILHGPFGEDGTIQGMLELANLPYVGAGVMTSAVGMDKVIMKKVFAASGIPQCLYRYFTRHEWEADREFNILNVEVTLGYPCFVKPANLGSSVGISKAANREELVTAIEYAFQYDRKVIVEEFVDARECEIAVLGNEEPRVSVVGEIVAAGLGSEFYDYNAKYVDGKSQMIIPADLPAGKAEEARELAAAAYLAVDGAGLSRIDFFYGNDGRWLLNEINTMPGFTEFSMYPALWQASGISYAELVDDFITLALRRHADKQRIHYGM
jgi:D-alanine-D-alanine ligase